MSAERIKTNSDKIKLLPLIALDSGKILGNCNETFVLPASYACFLHVIDTEGKDGASEKFLPLAKVVAIEDAIVIRSASNLVSEVDESRFSAPLPVFTTKGKSLGKLINFDFENGKAVTFYANSSFLPSQIVSVSDAVIVTENPTARIVKSKTTTKKQSTTKKETTATAKRTQSLKLSIANDTATPNSVSSENPPKEKIPNTEISPQEKISTTEIPPQENITTDAIYEVKPSSGDANPLIAKIETIRSENKNDKDYSFLVGRTATADIDMGEKTIEEGEIFTNADVKYALSRGMIIKLLLLSE